MKNTLFPFLPSCLDALAHKTKLHQILEIKLYSTIKVFFFSFFNISIFFFLFF